MYIAYVRNPSGTYATVVRSDRVNGKVVKTVVRYLGKVVDEVKGVYESKDGGLITYNLATDTVAKADLSLVPPKRRGGRKACLDFGDVYVLDRYMKESGMMHVIDGCECQNKDTLKALLCFYILTDEPHSCAQTWFDGSYASILYPGADMDDRRLSEFLSSMGDAVCRKSFFDLYLPMVTKGNVESYIIDSTGVPNSIHMPITAISNHNGQISLEVRLVFVCRRSDRMPLYFRDIPGNVIDSSTITRTIEEVEQMGLIVDHIIMDAGYCTLENMRALVDSSVHFLTRLKPNYDMYKEMVKDHVSKLTVDMRLKYKGRFMRVYSAERKLTGHSRKVWLHLILDEDTKRTEDLRDYDRWQDGEITEAERDIRYELNGLFVLVSSYGINREDVLTDYFERNGIEQLIDTAKTNCRLAEAAVHSEDTLRGKWLVEFAALAITQGMQNNIKARKKEMMDRKRKNKDSVPGRNMTVSNALFTLRSQKCDIFDTVVLPRERTAAVNIAYGLYDYVPPRRINRG